MNNQLVAKMLRNEIEELLGGKSRVIYNNSVLEVSPEDLSVRKIIRDATEEEIELYEAITLAEHHFKKK